MQQAIAPALVATARPTARAVPLLSTTHCKVLAALLIAGFALAHVVYLTYRCPIDLAEDEAYYWDYSRQLDLSFYSKGPLTALLVRGSCALLGDTPLGVRFPAILMRVGVGLCTYWLTRRLFRSDRMALGATLLGYLTPIFLTAGLIMTTDPPYLFLWALATCLAFKALWDENSAAWLGIGLSVGAGFLVKFSMPLWYVGIGLFFFFDRPSRNHLRRPWLWVGMLLGALCSSPVFIWNARHGWLTFLHVGEDIGVTEGKLSLFNPLDFWVDQLGVVGPLFLILLPALIAALRISVSRARWSPSYFATDTSRALRFLLCMGAPVLLGVFLSSFRKHAAANWTASCYFTFFIIAAWFLSSRLDSRKWRWLLYPSVAFSVALILLAHNTTLLYPLLKKLSQTAPSLRISARTDPTFRVHGWAEVGHKVEALRVELGPGTPVMAVDYPTTAELAFYLPDQPKTYCVGSYFTGTDREPFCQYDVWVDRRLDGGNLVGRTILYLGPMKADVQKAFDRVRPLEPIVVQRRGLVVRKLTPYACYGFRGLAWPGWEGKYNK